MKVIDLFKDLFFRLLTLLIAIVLIAKGFNPSKNTVRLRPKPHRMRLAKSIAKEKEEFGNLKNKEEKLLSLVEKLNSYIDEQSHLLSYLDDNLKEKDIDALLKNIDNIKQEAKKRKISNLIDVTQIDELETQLQIYQQAIEKNKV